MNPGKELDALIAEKVFGRKTEYWFKILAFKWEGPPEAHIGSYPFNSLVPSYSSLIADAWTVVEKMYELGCGYCLERCEDATNWTVHFMPNQPQTGGKKAFIRYVEDMDRISQEAKSLPHAICLAALKALGVEVP